MLFRSYENLTKNTMKVSNGEGTAANFTQFGVGCSFSDNEEERALRNEITDQACRGWFSSGLVSSGVSPAENASVSQSQSAETVSSSNQKSLIDDTMFVQAGSFEANGALDETKNQPAQATCKSGRYRKTLVQGLNIRRS